MYEHERVPIAVCEKEPSSIIAFALRYWCDLAFHRTYFTFVFEEYLNFDDREQAWQSFNIKPC